jgi:hypothetical protein
MPKEKKQIPPDFHIRIRNKRWKICFVSSDKISRYSYGECDWPQVKNPKIYVRRKLSEAQLLNTTIHEILHAVRPELCEEAVLETANVIAASLRKMGVSIPKRKKKSK